MPLALDCTFNLLYYLLCVYAYKCVSAWTVCVYVSVFVVYACASMWLSGECVACSHAQGPDYKCYACMWWLIATRHNRTLNQTQAWFLYLGTMASVLWGDLTGVLLLIQLQKEPLFGTLWIELKCMNWTLSYSNSNANLFILILCEMRIEIDIFLSDSVFTYIS